MRKIFVALCLLGLTLQANAQLIKIPKPEFNGMYFQWGYNRDFYSKSTIHFTNPGKYDFKVHDAVAYDQPNWEAFYKTPLDITIPQNSFRIGVYLNKKRSHAIELNYDHAKYVVAKYQKLRLTGEIGGEQIDADTVIHPYFMSFEHTNGANFWQINYVGQQELWTNHKRMKATTVWKAGAGVVIPRSDVILMGKQADNQFHLAGYMFSVEGGFRLYPLKNLFAEVTGKAGHANYLDVLTIDEGRARHSFYFAELIGLIGYDINFRKKKKPVELPESAQ